MSRRDAALEVLLALIREKTIFLLQTTDYHMAMQVAIDLDRLVSSMQSNAADLD